MQQKIIYIYANKYIDFWVTQRCSLLTDDRGAHLKSLLGVDFNV